MKIVVPPLLLTGLASVGARTRAIIERLNGPATATDDGRVEMRRGLYAIVLFFGLFLGWAAFAPLDAAVVAQGVVVVSGNRQTVQHRDGGVITRLAVREGQTVRAGDVLVELGASELLARERSLFSQQLDLQMQRARLNAAVSNAATLERPAEWASLSNEDKAEADAAWQRHQAEGGRPWTEFDARISGYRDELTALGRQEVLLNDELGGMRELAAEQYMPLTRVRAMERALADLEGRRGELRASIAAAREARDNQLREVSSKLSELLPQLISAREQLERTRLRAPVSGIVVGLQQHTVGGVIRPGDRVLDIVPQGGELVIEAQIRPEDADDLHVGQATEVKITAFSGRDLPIMDGTVQQVSADRFTDERTGAAYFMTRVVVSKAEVDELARESNGARSLRAGLPAQIVATTRKRTALQYMIEPLNQTLWRSFREG